MIVLALLLAGAEPAPVATAPALAPAEKVKCKTRPVIGSLAQTVKECHTVAEWEVLRQGTQNDARRIMNSAASSRGS